jgi:hypothetical protein
MSMLTLFSAPKAFQGHIGLIQRNALASWRALSPELQILLLGDEPGTAEAAAEHGAEHLAEVARNAAGTPRLDSIFCAAEQAAHHDLLCYVNADILLLGDLLPAVAQVSRALHGFLILGRRWDLTVEQPLTFDEPGRRQLRLRLTESGRLHPPSGSDYFVFRKGQFADLPPFALGRAGWDNWMIYAARRLRLPVVDATGAITVIHQSHDYAHLPGGQPHYRLPESQDNVRLAGGREMIFTLHDASWRLEPDGLRRQRISPAGLSRTLEAALVARLGPGRLSRLVRLLWHPIDTLRYLAGRASGRIRPA